MCIINERLMSPGSYTIPFRTDTPYGLWDTLKSVFQTGGGHIVITPEALDSRMIGDTGMLAAARYTGPLLEKTMTDGTLSVAGAGMGWWLGDDQAGDVYTTKVSLSGTEFSTAITALLPSALTAGTLTNTTSSVTGVFHYDTPRDAINSACAIANGEWRANPDGTLDAGANSDLFTITTPTVVVTRLGSGSDPNFNGVPTATLKSHENARTHTTAAALINIDSGGNVTALATAAQSPAVTGKDIHGNTVVRTLVYESSPSASASAFLRSELNEYRTTLQSTLSTGYWEIVGGSFNVGDAFWVWDPPAFVDTTNQIRFRGDLVFPRKMRLLAASWPLVRGMGVAFRDDTGTYTDLTDWIEWEAQDQSVGLGLQGTDLGPRIHGASTLQIRDFVPVVGGC